MVDDEAPEPKPISAGTGPEVNGDKFTLDRAGYLTLSEDMDKGENDAELLRDYRTAAKVLMVEPGVSRLCDGLFQNFSNLEIAYIPSSVRYIGLYTFRECESLKEVVIFGRDVTLRAYAFLDCKSLIFVQIPEGVTEIPVGCFCGCTNLETVVLPESLVSIEDDAFHNCPNLTSVVGPSVRTIGKCAFSSSPNLSVDFPSKPEIEEFAFHLDVMKQLGLIEFI